MRLTEDTVPPTSTVAQATAAQFQLRPVTEDSQPGTETGGSCGWGPVFWGATGTVVIVFFRFFGFLGLKDDQTARVSGKKDKPIGDDDIQACRGKHGIAIAKVLGSLLTMPSKRPQGKKHHLAA